MPPPTRVDKVVELRERAEDHALAGLARAQATVTSASARLARAVEVTRRDGRAGGPVELWQVDELVHRRALQDVRAAEAALREARQREAQARDGYAAARQGTKIVQRVQERRRAEIRGEREKRERREVDELATLRFNLPR
ncbi:hypothetical protein [Anaeromyxobacter diazotrophicus]|uniref:Flagellar FliJ protein n=1 Tax=Anaeromyxobacter diazotrophicus TaxID=2590199 RepID=A0A7I9VS04_9BACT|nr:hypothetical protein [Anaeromyxobacter diazotrophicus]GEJ59185.1 hypothetical protein AMYX_39260 [Anaeromyxobacter diazotrophicus]